MAVNDSGNINYKQLKNMEATQLEYMKRYLRLPCYRAVFLGQERLMVLVRRCERKKQPDCIGQIPAVPSPGRKINR
jgi:hypothetical protein